MLTSILRLWYLQNRPLMTEHTGGKKSFFKELLAVSHLLWSVKCLNWLVQNRMHCLYTVHQLLGWSTLTEGTIIWFIVIVRSDKELLHCRLVLYLACSHRGHFEVRSEFLMSEISRILPHLPGTIKGRQQQDSLFLSSKGGLSPHGSSIPHYLGLFGNS